MPFFYNRLLRVKSIGLQIAMRLLRVKSIGLQIAMRGATRFRLVRRLVVTGGRVCRQCEWCDFSGDLRGESFFLASVPEGVPFFSAPRGGGVFFWWYPRRG